MAKAPTKSEIQLWIPAATDIFKSIMPPINTPYPQVIIANGRNIEPTCISDVDDERFRVQLWKMKDLLETQVKKEKFWEIDEDFLLEIGTCIGELMFAKLKVMSEHF